MGVYSHPAITINNFTFRGDAEGRDIFIAVCAGFKSKPAECKTMEWDNPELDNSGVNAIFVND